MFSHEPTSLLTRLLTQGNKSLTDLGFAQRRGGFISRTISFNLGGRFHLRGEVFSLEPTSPLTRILTQGKKFLTELYITRENISIEIYLVSSLKNPYKGKRVSPSTMYNVTA